jgi:hypothetical protein
VGSDSLYEFFGWFNYRRLFYGEKTGGVIHDEPEMQGLRTCRNL